MESKRKAFPFSVLLESKQKAKRKLAQSANGGRFGYLVFATFLQQSPDVVCGDGGRANRVVPHVVDPPNHRLCRQGGQFNISDM